MTGLEELGIISTEELVDLDDEDIQGLKLKKFELRRFTTALNELKKLL